MKFKSTKQRKAVMAKLNKKIRGQKFSLAWANVPMQTARARANEIHMTGHKVEVQKHGKAGYKFKDGKIVPADKKEPTYDVYRGKPKFRGVPKNKLPKDLQYQGATEYAGRGVSVYYSKTRDKNYYSTGSGWLEYNPE